MAASLLTKMTLPPLGRRTGVLMLAIPILIVVATSWWLTADLTDSASDATELAAAKTQPPAAPVKPEAPLTWPKERLEGDAAKRLLLKVLVDAQTRLDEVEGYTAIFRKQERFNGVLAPEQTMRIKVRHRPFAIYLKFLKPTEGKEVVYAEGHHDNLVIAHSTGVARWLVPRLAVPPDHPLALAENRHAITEAGLANLTSRLVGFRRADLEDPDAVTILDRTTGPDNQPRFRSVHLHSIKCPERPFGRVEVLYDPETFYPVQISNYDWPEPGHENDPPLAERYTYESIDTNVTLSALDFDPKNPAYAFHRY